MLPPVDIIPEICQYRESRAGISTWAVIKAQTLELIVCCALNQIRNLIPIMPSTSLRQDDACPSYVLGATDLVSDQLPGTNAVFVISIGDLLCGVCSQNLGTHCLLCSQPNSQFDTHHAINKLTPR
jgi:hypothetical protein